MVLATVVEDASSYKFPSATSDDDDGQLRGVVSADEHARTNHEHGIVERGAFAFLHGVELVRNVAELLEEEPVHLEPVGCIGVRKEVMDHVVHAEIREAQGGVIVVELQIGRASCRERV